MNIFPIGAAGKSCWDIGLGTTGARCDIGTGEGTIGGLDPARALDWSILYAGCVSIIYSTSRQRCLPPGAPAGPGGPQSPPNSSPARPGTRPGRVRARSANTLRT